MKLNEAIKKAYEKDYNLKSKNTAGYVGYVRIHCEKNGETRFDKMKQTHPKQYDYCMNQLALKTVIDEYLKCSPRKDSK